ncbi:MAG: hypothetical protein EHM28_14110, partial [Spirochaetaceae bacterium]
DYHFGIEGKNGLIYKKFIGFSTVNPVEFLSTGLYIQFTVEIQESEFPLSINSDMYVEFSTTPVIKLLFTDKNDKLIENAAVVLLTPKNPKFAFNPSSLDFSSYRLPPVDSDHDGLPDAFELLYDFNPLNRDSDGDNFSDFDELFMGWNPFSAELAENQSTASLQEALDMFAAEYRRKPTWKNAIHDFSEQIQFKYTDEDSQTVLKTIEFHNLDEQLSSEQTLFKQFLASSEHDFYKTFDFGAFFNLLGFMLLLGFLHTGSSGPGKGILLAFMTKEDRDFKSGLTFCIAFAVTHLVVSIVVSILVHLVIQPMGIDSKLILYMIQLVAGAALFSLAAIFIFQSIRKLKEKIIVSKKTFFDQKAGTIMISAVTALGTSPYLLAIIDFFLDIEQPVLIPFFYIAFGIGIGTCLLLVALAIMGVRHILFDIFPRLIHYAELASSIFFLIFSLFFLFPVVPF